MSLACPRDTSEGRPQDVGRTHPLELPIRPYGDLLTTSDEDVLKISRGASLGVTYRTIWKRPQNVTLGRLQDVIFQRPEDVGRGRPQDVGRGCLLV